MSDDCALRVCEDAYVIQGAKTRESRDPFGEGEGHAEEREEGEKEGGGERKEAERIGRRRR